MDKRIIDLSESAASLKVKYDQLVIKIDETSHTVPLEELAALVVSHPAVHYTHAVLSGICANGGIFVLCNEKRLPIGMILPLSGHYTQTERIAAQTSASVPLKKQLWKSVIKAKIKAQARLLIHLRGKDSGLLNISRKVKSGDPENIEAQASKRYWPTLFGPAFRRIPGATDPLNSVLNYGYAILRGVTARAICAVGLHPSIGLHHHNRYNPFCLVDDMMEPYRPLIDKSAIDLYRKRGESLLVDKESKGVLIGSMISKRYILDGESRTIFDHKCPVKNKIRSGNPNIMR